MASLSAKHYSAIAETIWNVMHVDNEQNPWLLRLALEMSHTLKEMDANPRFNEKEFVLCCLGEKLDGA